MPTDKLKPCPFCGGEAEVEVEVEVKRNECRYHEMSAPDEYRILCARCGACNSSYSYKDKAGQIKAWNTRATTKREEKLREALEEYKSAFIFMCVVWVELDNLRDKLITQKDKTTVQDKLVMEWPMLQGTRNQMNIRKIAKIPYDKTQVGKAVKQALPKKES